jgi:hypothetical protein
LAAAKKEMLAIKKALRLKGQGSKIHPSSKYGSTFDQLLLHRIVVMETKHGGKTWPVKVQNKWRNLVYLYFKNIEGIMIKENVKVKYISTID